MSALFVVEGLRAALGGQEIVRGVSVSVDAGGAHVIMGPNGAGKSTLAHVLAGYGAASVVAGTVSLAGQDMLALEPEARAHAGLFLAFQRPPVLPGVRGMTLLREAMNAKARALGQELPPPREILARAREAVAALGLDEAMLKRDLFEGFSGGETRRMEAALMLALDPKVAILDEIDSGLDVDALRLAERACAAMRERGAAILAITHSVAMARALAPDRVSALVDGRIAQVGDASLADELGRGGFAALRAEPV